VAKRFRGTSRKKLWPRRREEGLGDGSVWEKRGTHAPDGINPVYLEGGDSRTRNGAGDRASRGLVPYKPNSKALQTIVHALGYPVSWTNRKSGGCLRVAVRVCTI